MLILFFQWSPALFRVGFPVGNGYFSTPFNTHGTYFSYTLMFSIICPVNAVRRKVAEHVYNHWFVVGYVMKNIKNWACLKIPRGIPKTFILGYIHIKPVPPTPLPYPQVSMTIYVRFWLVCKTKGRKYLNSYIFLLRAELKCTNKFSLTGRSAGTC